MLTRRDRVPVSPLQGSRAGQAQAKAPGTYAPGALCCTGKAPMTGVNGAFGVTCYANGFPWDTGAVVCGGAGACDTT